MKLSSDSNTLSSYIPVKEPLSFDTKPDLNFIFGHHLANPNKKARGVNGKVPVKIDLTKQEEIKEPTKFLEISIEEGYESSELNEDDLELLKECLNKKAKANGDCEVRKECTIWKSECETDEVKEIFNMYNFILNKIKKLIPQIKLLVSTNEKIIQMNDSAIVRNPESVSDESLLSSAVQCIGKVNFEEIGMLIRSLEEFDYTSALDKLLQSQPINSKEVQDLQRERDSLQSKLEALQNEYEELLVKQVPNKSRLAQILAYFYRKKNDGYSKIIVLNKKVNESLKKLTVALKDKELLDKSNGELQVKVSELILLIREKEKEVSNLKKHSEELKTKLEKLSSDYDEKIKNEYRKDMEFATQVKEMKKIFNDMRQEKISKQHEIELLMEKNESLKKCIEEMQALIPTNPNNAVQGGSEMERAIGLAKVILEKSKRSAQITLKDDEQIHEVLSGNNQSLLDEISKLKRELRTLKENKSNLYVVMSL